MKELKLIVGLTKIAKFSLRIVWMLPSSRRRISHAHTHVRVLRTTEVARVSIILATEVLFTFILMASLGKYAFRIHNPYLFIDCTTETGIVEVYWRSEE